MYTTILPTSLHKQHVNVKSDWESECICKKGNKCLRALTIKGAKHWLTVLRWCLCSCFLFKQMALGSFCCWNQVWGYSDLHRQKCIEVGRNVILAAGCRKHSSYVSKYWFVHLYKYLHHSSLMCVHHSSLAVNLTVNYYRVPPTQSQNSQTCCNKPVT